MDFRRLTVILAFLTVGFSFRAFSQSAVSALPQDPTVLMKLAHDKNGLTGADIKPWHMRGAYHSYKDGKLDDEGTYEEWWFSPTQYRLTFTNPKTTQTDYATGTALMREGSQEWLNGPELLLRASLVEPLPETMQLPEFKLQADSHKVGKAKIECVSFTYQTRAGLAIQSNFFPAACFELTQPVLRIFTMGAGNQTIYDSIVAFQGRYLARQIRVFVGEKLAADLNIDLIEELKESPESVITPPASAVPVDLALIKTRESTVKRWPTALIKAAPVYPSDAKMMHAQGTVDVKVIIGPDGHIQNPQIVDGPKPLRGAALDAARQWVYRYFNVMGQPRPVETVIHFIFSLG
jgi:TonB family protein